MDAVPIEAAIEARSECTDRARAEAVLVAALAAARAPARRPAREAAWRLSVKVSAPSPGTRVAAARIVDDAGEVVAERLVADKTAGSCLALAQAVGAWAEIVLDDELARADPAPAPEWPPAAVTPARDAPPLGPVDADVGTEGEAPRVPTFEVGTTLFLRNGASVNGGIFGASPYVTIGLTERWVVRPSALLGTSTSKVPPDQSRSANVTLVGGRLDLCRRLPGNYIDHRGIEVDLCAGGDAAYVWSALQSAARVSAGPSAVVRGHVGTNVALEIRGMVGANLARSGLGPDASFVVAGAELGGSVRFR